MMTTPFLLIFILWFIEATSKECQTVNWHSHLGTKTPYRLVENKNDTKLKFEECKSTKAWMIIRHGSRYPGKKIIKKILEKLPKLRDEILQNSDEGHLCESELESFKKWFPKIDTSYGKNLSHTGEDEMIEMAERMQLRFPRVFPETYSNFTYKFKYTATQRAEASARHFAVGLFGKRNSRYVWYPDPVARDPILRFYKLCNKWRSEIKQNPATYKERDRFAKSSFVETVLLQISKHLGFSYVLPFDIVKLMYTTCGFETSWNSKTPSPWCYAFPNNTIEAFEFAEDIKYYWVDGYGYKFTREQACPAIKNMFNLFLSNESDPRTVVYFTHSGTLLKVLAHLGLYKDELLLTHDRYNILKDRQWRVSKIGAFATNLAFILFDCGQTKKILTLHQERIVHLPNCSNDDGLCPLDILLNTYRDSFHNCHFDEMCGRNVQKD